MLWNLLNAEMFKHIYAVTPYWWFLSVFRHYASVKCKIKTSLYSEVSKMKVFISWTKTRERKCFTFEMRICLFFSFVKWDPVRWNKWAHVGVNQWSCSSFPSPLLWSSVVMWLIFSVMCVWSFLHSVHPDVSSPHGVCVTPWPPGGAAGALGHALRQTGRRERRNQAETRPAGGNPHADHVWVTVYMCISVLLRSARLDSELCLCGVLHVLPLSPCIPQRFSGFLPLL